MNTRVFSLSLAIVTIVAFFGLVSQPVAAATITVTTTDDELDAGYATDCDPGSESDCSLREAIELANENGEDDTIQLSAGEYLLDMTSTGEDFNADGDLDILETTTTTTIEGAGVDSTTINGNSDGRVFDIRNSGTSAIITDLSITGGEDSYASAIQVRSGTDVRIQRVDIYGNAVVSGGAYTAGAILASGDTTIEDTELYSNTADVGSPGIVQSSSGYTLTMDSVLVYDNTAESTAGAINIIGIAAGNTTYITNSSIVDNTTSGIRQFSASASQVSTLHIAHSTIANNSEYGIRVSRNTINIRNSILSGNETDQCNISSGFGFVESEGYNIDSGTSCDFDEETDMSSTDPELGGSLVTNGGTIRTYAINSSSDAVDAVPSAACLDAEDDSMSDDIRGLARPENDDCDIGAYEVDQTGATVILDPPSLTLECAAESWTAPTVTSVTDNFDTTVTTASLESNNVDENTAGSYNVVYASTADYDGNIGRASQAVTIEDTTVPVITVDETEVSTEAGETYTDSVISVVDTCDEEIALSATGTVDTDTLGEYTITYSATDASDNDATEKTRTVTVEDTTAPVITLTGESESTITVGDSYTDAGATATDSFEGDLTGDIVVTGSVDAETAGTYSITYNVSDSSGNTATEVIRTVTVEEAAEDPEEEEGGDGESEEPENDPETGEGDGTDDTEEDLGAVVSLTRSTDSMVTVEYENGDTKTFQLFSASAKAKVQLHTNGAVLIAINKRYMRTFDAFTGEQLDQVKLFKAAQYKTKFKRFNVYKKVPGKNNVVVLAQTKKKHKKQFKLRSFVVKNGGAITKRPYRTIRLNKNAKFSKLSIAKNKKNGKKARILIKKNGKTLKNWKYQVTKKKGILKKAI